MSFVCYLRHIYIVFSFSLRFAQIFCYLHIDYCLHVAYNQVGGLTMENNFFSHILRELRNEHKLTLEELSNDLKISKSLLWDIEKGRRRIHSELLKSIADYFNVSTDYLLGRTQMGNKGLVGYLQEKDSPYLLKNDEETKVLSVLRRTHPNIVKLIKKASELPEDQQEMIAGHWKWALDVVRQQEAYKTKSEQPPRVTEEESKYPSTEEPEDDIDVRSTAMAANLEDGTESIPLTPKLENLIEDSIKEARKIKRERESQQEEKRKKSKSQRRKGHY